MANINPETIEESIKDKLQAGIGGPGVEVVVLPENDADYKKPFAVARVTVAYHSSRYENTEPGISTFQRSSGAIVQEQYVDVEIVVEARKLRGAAGVHNLIRLAKRNLVGFKPTGCGRLTAVSDKFGGREDGIWMHSLTVRCSAMVVEAPEATTEPTLTRVTHELTT